MFYDLYTKGWHNHICVQEALIGKQIVTWIEYKDTRDKMK